MQRINYKSDFKINEICEVENLVSPFRFTYKTKKESSYVVEFDGENYTNCRRLEDGSLLVIFDAHGLDVGQLQVRREYFIEDNDFSDGICNQITINHLDIELVCGEGDCVDANIYPCSVQGDSAYIVAVKNGFEGSEAEWIESLVGGVGDSAYQLAIKNGFEGSEPEWIESLQGKAFKYEDFTPEQLKELRTGVVYGSTETIEDIEVITSVGNLKAGDIIPKGTNLESLIRMMLVKTIGVYTTPPTATLNNTGSAAGSYEVGSTVTPLLSAALTSGGFFIGSSGYNYNLSAGCSQNGDPIYKRGGTALDSNSDSYTLTDESSVSYSASINYDASTETPVNNMGEELSISIPAGVVSTNSIGYSGKYRFYWGYLDILDITELDDSDILSYISNGSFISKGSRTLASSGTQPARQSLVIIAPTGTSVTGMYDILNNNMSSLFTSTNINYTYNGITTNYVVWIKSNLAASGQTFTNLTISR